MMAELLGKATGYCRGKGGSMHIADLDLGILGANGIVGGGIGIATGAAYSADLRESGQVSVCFFGDGASNQGILMEAANMAALWKLPVIYLCEENQYAEFSPCKPFIAVDDIADKAQAFGLPGVTVDGNDVLAVYEAVRQAAGRARSGHGPTLLVAQTYRIEGHTVGDPLTYRPKGETDEWKSPERDPISRFGRRLTGEVGFSEGELEALQGQARAVIDDAVAFAIDSPDPEVRTLWQDVYA
jgi:TPP-dependent pyruvate/acetoin dehydrogenase alpha subunit